LADGQIYSAADAMIAGVAVCVITGNLTPAVGFQVTVPCDWNGELLFQGNGGFGGSIPSPDATPSPGMLGNATCGDGTAGYAIATTNMGHTASAFDGSWILSNPEAVDDFAFRAVHVTAAAAHEILQMLKGRDASHAYFEGCSDGGREGLMAAQRYPQDFDGIIARAPASNLTGLHLTGNTIARRLAIQGATPSNAKLSLLGQAQQAACDGLDGLEDGIIGLPAACTGIPEMLRCPSGTDAPDCLTDEEVATFEQVRAPTPLFYAQANGLTEYPGYPPGNEESIQSWPLWLTVGVPPFAPTAPPLKMQAQDATIRYLIAGDASIDPLQVNLTDYTAAFERESLRADATDPDLAPFFNRGGKLILWHGITDPAISANGTTAYYEAVRDTVGAQADTSMRFYLAPGVLHCRGGTGADTVDLVTPLANWVKNGTAPENELVAARYPFGMNGLPNTDMPYQLSRPLCRYPLYPRWDGTGPSSEAGSFSCEAPP
jgi:feruloyl esterase